MRTALVATKRTGGIVILAGPEVGHDKQLEMRDALFISGSDEFASAEVCYLAPCKPAVTLKTIAQAAEKPPQPAEPVETKTKRKTK